MNKFKPIGKVNPPEEKAAKPDESDGITLPNGEKIPRTDKLFTAVNSLEELIAYLGTIKAEHFSGGGVDGTMSAKLFLFARITQIQEGLNEIIRGLLTSKKNNARYENSRFSSGAIRIKELDLELDKLAVKTDEHIPGVGVAEAKLYYAAAICRRAERQVILSKNLTLGLVPDEIAVLFLRKLADYLQALAVSTVKKETKNTNLK